MKLFSRYTFQKFTALFLLAIISFFITPKELIHEMHHHDTVDAICKGTCKEHISNQHQHCDVLQLTTPPLYHEVAAFSFTFVSLPFSFLVKNTTDYITDRDLSAYLRGPPSLS